ncbi:Ubiquitin SMT3 [Hyphodiscus hymeniophilus]|uniref:Ubiquitin SMT3 n=1 Tax=Hyphodiscus hymeniophilus TaxID=353542 RepID=A0A9P7AVN9_9HELO|nr:Ubiquitin SMT3 [Hyphodiscus hymeniophilus]
MAETKPDMSGENAGDAAPKHIRIKVKDDQHNEIEFKLKVTTPLEKLMKAYASQQGKAADSLRFFTPDGQRVLPTDTP